MAIEMNKYQFLLQGNVDIGILHCGKRENSYNHRFAYPVKEYLLCFVKSGSALLRNSHTPGWVRLQAGNMFVLFPYDVDQRYETDPGVMWTDYWICVSGRFVQTFLERIGLSPASPVIPLPRYHRIEEKMEKMLIAMQSLNYASALQCQEYLFHIMRVICEDYTTPTSRDYVEQALYIIQNNFDQNLSLAGIANSININKSYLARLFKEKQGETVLDCLTACRMAEAKRLLASGEYAVGEVASLCGFPDQFYFSRIFKEHTGTAPSDYRTVRR